MFNSFYNTKEYNGNKLFIENIDKKFNWSQLMVFFENNVLIFIEKIYLKSESH